MLDTIATETQSEATIRSGRCLRSQSVALCFSAPDSRCTNESPRAGPATMRITECPTTNSKA
jgi:hypothetical protein